MMVKVPLQLWNRPHWELKGAADPRSFFAHLRRALPGATTVFVEGSHIAPDVERFLQTAATLGDYLPERQTIWPRAARYCLPCDEPTLAALADLSTRHAEPELFDHLFVYRGLAALLEFPDAFGRNCPMYVSADVGEAEMRAFAGALGLAMEWFGP
jgi:hypothetical protein